ncbi:hypothetical protein Trydic_g21506 [Trypoxylus dichotomus]
MSSDGVAARRRSRNSIGKRRIAEQMVVVAKTNAAVLHLLLNARPGQQGQPANASCIGGAAAVPDIDTSSARMFFSSSAVRTRIFALRTATTTNGHVDHC